MLVGPLLRDVNTGKRKVKRYVWEIGPSPVVPPAILSPVKNQRNTYLVEMQGHGQGGFVWIAVVVRRRPAMESRASYRTRWRVRLIRARSRKTVS